MPALFYNGIKGIICKGNKLLILRNQDHNGKYYWDIPGGRMEANEQITDALERELSEELPGISNVQNPRLISAWRLPRNLPDGNGLILMFHLVEADISDTPELSHEHSAFRWITKDDLKTLGDKDTYIDAGYSQALSDAFKLLLNK